MKKIFYWSPCLSKVGTTNSTINSATGMSKFFNNEYKIFIINSCGEWDKYINHFQSNNVEVINLNFSYLKYLPKKGFLGSRISYIIIFFILFHTFIEFIKERKTRFYYFTLNHLSSTFTFKFI